MIFEQPGEPPPLSPQLRAALFWGLVPVAGALRNVVAAAQARRLAQDGAAKRTCSLAAIAIIDVLAVAALLIAMFTPLRGKPRPLATERRSVGILRSAPVDGGLRVDELIDDGPASAGGLKVGDVVREVDGQPISTGPELSERLQSPGAHLFRIRRGGGEATVQVLPDRASTVTQRIPLFRTARSGADRGAAAAGLHFPLVLLAPGALLAIVAVYCRRRIPAFLPLAAFVAAHLIAAGAAAGSLMAVARATSDGWGAFLVAQVAMDLAFLAVGGWFWSRRGELGIAAPDRGLAVVGGWVPSELPAREWAKAGALCAILLLPRVNVIGIVLGRALHDWHLGESPFESAAMPPLGLALMAAVAVFLAPAAEEILFRGILYGWLRRFLPAPASIAICAAAFALFHLHYGARILGIFVIGCVLGWVRERSGTLRAPIATHALNNAVGTAFVVIRYMSR